MFDEYVPNESVYRSTCLPLVDSVLDGYVVSSSSLCLFTELRLCVPQVQCDVFCIRYDGRGQDAHDDGRPGAGQHQGAVHTDRRGYISPHHSARRWLLCVNCFCMLKTAARAVRVQETPDREYRVRCSFLEIYNEHIKDLLSDRDRLTLDLQVRYLCCCCALCGRVLCVYLFVGCM